MSTLSVWVLLIEDNPADARLVQEILSETNGFEWNIVHAESLTDGSVQLSKRSFDVVLSDLSLPDAHGLDTITQIRAVALDVPIVVLTGLNDEAIGLEALRQGAQDYLVKGQLEPNLLTRTIRYAIERSRTQMVVQQQAAAMDACREGIAILNPNYEYTYLNQAYADLYGYNSSSELLGEPWSGLYKTDEQRNLEQQIEIELAEQGYWCGEAISQRRDGKIFNAELSLTALQEGSLVCTVRDVTARKQAEAKVLRMLEREKELNELKSRFISIVSHEFRTPLATILSSTELLQNYGYRWTDDKKQVHFERILNGVQRMSDLLSDILVIDQEADRLQFAPAPLPVVEFCQKLLAELEVDNKQRPISFTSHGCSHSIPLDSKLLRYILTNLLSNAMKYSSDGDEICCELECQAEKVVFRIRDRGIGIPLEDQEQLFTAFHRASNVGTISGTGLGLAIAKQCVTLHGGTIHCDSVPGEGTTFTVNLPLSLPA